MSKTWVYHKELDAKIVNQSEADSYYEAGWADSPAAFFDMAKAGFEGNSTDEEVIGKAIEGVKNAANGALNLKEMTKKELVEYAEVHCGHLLDIKAKKAFLLKEVKKLVEV